MRDLIINGVPMRDPLQKWRPDYTRSSLLNTVSRAAPSTDQIAYHGVDATGPAYFGAGQHTLVLNLEAANREEFYQLLTALQSLFSAPILKLTSAPQISPLRSAPTNRQRANRTFNVASGLIREATARMIGSLAVEYINERVARLTAVIELPGAFWYSQDQYTNGMEVTQGTNTLDLTELNIAGDSTAPMGEGLLRVEGQLASGATLTIRDRGLVDHGLVIRPTALLQPTEFLLIDLKTLNARKQTSATWDITAGTDARNYLELTGNGGFVFEPEAGFDLFPSTPNRYWASVIKNDSEPAQIDLRMGRAYL